VTRPVVVLGATGSIGTQTLEVADRLGFEVVGVAARSASPELAGIALRYPDAMVAAAGGATGERETLAGMVGERVRFGTESILEMARSRGAIVVNGIVGSAGLVATVAALEAGNRVALANKESLVAGGPVVKAALAGHGGELVPVDSEHSALLQCLAGESLDTVSRVILTASGGPFRGASPEELAEVTPEQALAHPTWDMGPRITVDSATLFNKGMEVIEAHFLFDIPYERIEVVVHPQSVLHSGVEFVDGSWKGHLGHPDMRIPIQYALTYPERAPTSVPPFDLAGRELTFEEPDRKTFPALDLAFEAGRRGGSAPAVLNAADEVAVEAFLQGRLGFTTIATVLERSLEEVAWRPLDTVDDVLSVDQEARAFAAGLIPGIC
jgi:1-deoxy-D-xylulose-5-phosphate reductoisomerase